MSLDPGPPSSASTFLLPGEGVSGGTIRGHSPVAGQVNYPANCGGGLTLNYPFPNATPLQPSGMVTPGAFPFRVGQFILEPGTGLPAVAGVVDNQCLPYWVGLSLDLAGGRKFYRLETFRSVALLPHDAPNGFPVDTRHFAEEVGALRVRLYCPGGATLAPVQVLADSDGFLRATLKGSFTLPACAPPHPGGTAAPGLPGTLHAGVRSRAGRHGRG